MKKQIISILFAIILIFMLKNTCNAATANISCDSSATVGKEITITANVNAVQWNLELKVNGETIATNHEVDNVDGNKSITFSGKYTPKSEGTLNVTLTGTATEFSDGSTIKNFESKTITVKAADTTPTNSGNTETPPTSTKSSEARLSNLGINPNDFSGFRRNTYTYTTEVPNSVSEVNVYAETVDKNAKITSGTGKVSLKEGDNTVKVTVTAEDGKTTNTYTLTIKRNTAEEESNTSEARLSNLGIKPDDYDFTGFKRDITSYSVEVPNDVEEIEVYATAVSSKAKITGTGKISLKEGKNTATVEVTSEDGTNKKTYTIEIIRKEATATTEEPENNETEKLGLASLSIKYLNISPKFAVDTYEYTVGLREDLSSLEIQAKANKENATIEIAGNENLQQGENIITILVTDSENSEVTTYQIIVNKNVIPKEESVNWLKPSTWKLREKIIAAIIAVLIIIIITAIIIKIKISRDIDEEIEFPGGEELDKALTEHQELEEEEDSQNDQSESDEEENEETKSDIEMAQEYFESYSKRKGKHF